MSRAASFAPAPLSPAYQRRRRRRQRKGIRPCRIADRSIVVAVRRVNIINEYDLAPRDDDVVAAEDESGDPADRVKRIGRLSGRTSRELIEGVVEVDEPIVRKIRVYGDAKQPAALRKHGCSGRAQARPADFRSGIRAIARPVL